MYIVAGEDLSSFSEVEHDYVGRFVFHASQGIQPICNGDHRVPRGPQR